jgi:double-stranded uracil-DNA glycosylase
MMPGKPVAARGKRFSPAELEAARRVRLADVIADDLVVLFCGANPGLSSAATGAPFAAPGDRWWPALYESGFTPRRLAPHEAHELLALGLGLTSIVRRPTVGVAELAQAEFVKGGRLLRRRVLARRPRWLAVLGVTAYRAAFGRPDAAVGLQEDTIGSTRLWILPNPSGLNAHYPPRALATEFARLRVAAGLPDRSRRLEDATLCRRKGPCRYSVRRRDGMELAGLWASLRREVEDRPAPLEVLVRVRREWLDMFGRIWAAHLDGLLPAATGEWTEVRLRFAAVKAARTLLSFGGNVEVVSPPEVRADLAAVAADVVTQYSNSRLGLSGRMFE